MELGRKFYKCTLCGNLVGLIHEGGGELTCCNQPMELLIPNSVDAAGEKHVPVLDCQGDQPVVTVGSVLHPMLDEHFIEWIYVCTKNGGHRYALKPGDEPRAVLCMDKEEILEIYAYCNLHGLWKADLT